MLITLTKPGLVSLDGKDSRLLPGPNQIASKEWKIHRTHPIIKVMIDEGDIVEEQEIEDVDDDQDVTDDFEHLKTLKAPQAKSLVEKTTNVKLLGEWLSREDRAPVKAALNKQIAVMNEPLEKRDRTQARQITTGKGADHVELEVRPNASDD